MMQLNLGTVFGNVTCSEGVTRNWIRKALLRRAGSERPGILQADKVQRDVYKAITLTSSTFVEFRCQGIRSGEAPVCRFYVLPRGVDFDLLIGRGLMRTLGMKVEID